MTSLRKTFALTLFALPLAACSGDSGPEMLEGFEPDAPAADEIQILSPIIRDLQPGTDVLMCTYLPMSDALEETIDVIATTGFQSTLSSHHAVLYTVNRERPVDTHECTDDDMVNISFAGAAGGGGMAGQKQALPDGVAYRMEAGHQLMVQTHWINTTTQPIDGQAAFNLQYREPSNEVELAQLFTWLTTDIVVPADSTGSAAIDCVVQDEMSFYQIAGHAHEHASNVKLYKTPASGGAAEVMYDQDWEEYMTFDPPFLKYSRDEAIQVHPGDTLRVECSYANTTQDDLVFPTEMCVGVGFFFPGTHQINCVDGAYDDR
jgi:hypothetical protein